MKDFRDDHRAAGLWPIKRAFMVALLIAIGLLVGAWLFVGWLLGSPVRTPAKALDTDAQLDLLKLVFSLVAGVGALVALVVAYRRQRVDEAAGERAERTQRHVEFDTAERRITELYGQAVAQLGNESAAVRLGGLYAMERLAQDYPSHRQTIVDVICAYLRMPWEDTGAGKQERHVRIQAQRLLTRHLVESESPLRWEGLRVDLSETVLVNFRFANCRTMEADFTRTVFVGEAVFTGAVFEGEVSFRLAEFRARSSFDDVRFSGSVGLSEAIFEDWVGFVGSVFEGSATFASARFGGMTSFRSVVFNNVAAFDHAEFDYEAIFTKARFVKSVGFDGAAFGGKSSFKDTIFCDSVRFVDGRFRGSTDFAEARAPSGINLATARALPSSHTWPSGWRLADQVDAEGLAELVL